MVNQKVVDYLKEGLNRGFKIETLKSKLLQGGFTEAVIEEAVGVVQSEKAGVVKTPPNKNIEEMRPNDFSENNLKKNNVDTEKTSESNKKKLEIGENKEEKIIDNEIKKFDKKNKLDEKKEIKNETEEKQKDSLNVEKKGGLKWMMFAGISIIVLIILFIVVNISSLVLGINNNIVYTIISVIGIVCWIFISLGYVRMGKLTDSKMLKVSGWMKLILPILLIGVIVIPTFFLGMIDSTGILLGESIEESLGVFGYVFGGVGIILMLLILIFEIILAIGLIKLKEKVKFAKLVGILKIVVLAGGFVLLIIGIFSAISMINYFFGALIDSTNGETQSLPDSLYVFIGVGIIYLILNIVFTIFETVMFFKASKKYELSIKEN